MLPPKASLSPSHPFSSRFQAKMFMNSQTLCAKVDLIWQLWPICMKQNARILIPSFMFSPNPRVLRPKHNSLPQDSDIKPRFSGNSTFSFWAFPELILHKQKHSPTRNAAAGAFLSLKYDIYYKRCIFGQRCDFLTEMDPNEYTSMQIDRNSPQINTNSIQIDTNSTPIRHTNSTQIRHKFDKSILKSCQKQQLIFTESSHELTCNLRTPSVIPELTDRQIDYWRLE